MKKDNYHIKLLPTFYANLYYTENNSFPISGLLGCKLNKGQTTITTKFNGRKHISIYFIYGRKQKSQIKEINIGLSITWLHLDKQQLFSNSLIVYLFDHKIMCVCSCTCFSMRILYFPITILTLCTVD